MIQGTMKQHYFNYSFIPLFDDNGKVYGVLNTCTYVTDLQLAKEEAQNWNERLKMAIDSSGIGTYEIDLTTKRIKNIWKLRCYLFH